MNRSVRRRITKLVKKAKAKGIILRKNDPITKTLQNLWRDLDNNFEAPQEFQRPLSWKSDNKIKYFNSILMNRIEGTIVIVNVVKALAALKRAAGSIQNDAYANYHKAIRLFEDSLARGHKFIILDGNNRLSFYMSLLNNEYRIPEGTYEYVQDKNDSTTSYFTVTRKANTFDCLPELVRDAILDRIQVVSEYTQTDWFGMSLIFINTNAMVAPNEQELRNASVSDWSEYVRKLRENNLNLLRLMFKDPITHYVGDEWIVDCLDLAIQAVEETETEVTFDRKINENRNNEQEYSCFAKCNPVNQGSKWKLYESELVDNFDVYEALFTSLSDWISKMIDEASTDEEKKYLKTKSLIQNLFYMMCNGVETYEEAVLAVDLHRKAYSDTTITYGPDEATFKNACSGSSAANVEFRYIILSRILAEVKKETLTDINFNDEFKLETA